ncbi:MAG: NAD(P)-dependent oxidoreductase [Cypionkella sp.]|uniref:NAD-dependent epimerase/dehydratase family protein n=1 Tax=Cypionkella sp. TaxID=2811411 RepID=UPI002ABA359C|nr:NAD(P)-dependent oxidoreductase [Cypionkella sp.]MDZ4310577.1 NAD(P)-dependent oxidoreductase [Cypionkella sp.]
MAGLINQTLVVGASGRVGRLLARAWARVGQAPTLQHRGEALAADLPQVEWHPLSGASLDKGRFRAMIVLAGVVRGDMTLNALLAEACCAAAVQAGIAQVLLASSSAVYGVNGGLACRENTPTHPVNDYGRSKLEAEAVANGWRARGLAITALRIGNVAGADALLAGIQPGQPTMIDCFADGTGPVRSYIGPITLADVLARLLGQDLPPVLNLGAPHPVAMADLAQAAGADWRYQAAPATAYQRITLDCDLLAQHYRFAEDQSDAATMVAEWQSTRGPQ